MFEAILFMLSEAKLVKEHRNIVLFASEKIELANLTSVFLVGW